MEILLALYIGLGAPAPKPGNDIDALNEGHPIQFQTEQHELPAREETPDVGL